MTDTTPDDAAGVDTEPTPAPEQAEPRPAPAPEPGVDDQAEDDSRLTKVRQEAKNLRTRLRDAEAERDSLRAAVAAMHHTEAVRVAEEHLSDGEDLFRGGVSVNDLLGEDGRLDPEKVTEATKRVAAEHPNWTPNRTVRSLQPGQASPSSIESQWQKVLRG